MEFNDRRLPTYEDALYSDAKVHQLPIAVVKKYRDPEVTGLESGKLRRITRSLRAGNPVLEPLHIVKGDNGPLLYDGHHRLEVAEREGLTHVPTRVTR